MQVIRRRTSRRWLDAVPLRLTAIDVRGPALRGPTATAVLALGAGACGALAVGRLAIGRATIRRLSIGQLDVGRLHVEELVVDRDQRPVRVGASAARPATEAEARAGAGSSD